jgi:hypothetical protein
MGTQKVLVEGSSVTASQCKEFFRQIEDGSISGIYLQMFLDRQLQFNLEKVNIDWTRVYKTLGMKFEPGNLAVETDPYHWDVYVLKGVTPNKVVAAFRELSVEVYTYIHDLDLGVPTNDRDPKNGSYRVRFKKTIEADPELANKSANDLTEEKIEGITLLERLLLELGYFLATGEHLDVENITLCSGSRDSDGGVPGVDGHAGPRKLCIGWCPPQHRDGNLRARAVVS